VSIRILFDEYGILLGGVMVNMLAIEPKVRGFRPGGGRKKSAARLSSERK
jgi:hypothetical protein